MTGAPETVFVVQRNRWSEPGPGRPPGERRRLPAAVPVATFPDLASARSECRRLEERARRGANPFDLGGPALFYQTSLDAGRLHDWLLDHGVPPPAGPEAGHAEWRSWWAARHKRLSKQQREAVWEALDKARFFEVTEQTAARAYGVLELSWKLGVESGDTLPCDCEGGWVRQLFRSHAHAEKAVAVLSDRRRAEERYGMDYEGSSHETFTVERLSGPWASRGECSVDDAPFAELVEAPLADAEVGTTAYLLQRQAIDPEGTFCTDNTGDPTEGQVPLALYPTRERAEAERRRCEEATRRLVSPFAFPAPHEYCTGGDYLGVSSLTYTRFLKAARGLGVPLPRLPTTRTVSPTGHCEYRSGPWLAWWDEHVDTMTEEQREAVWGLLDRLHFHTVVQVELSD
jgi:hypothetical protein